MSNTARVRWIVALLLASMWGVVWHAVGISTEATVIMPTASAFPGPTAPGPTPSSAGGDSGNPTPSATSGASGTGTGAGSGTGTGTGSGTGQGVDGVGPFGIAGDVGTVLEPGVTVPIDLTITNPNDRPIRITSLSIAIGSITAPLATPTLRCTPADFAVGQPEAGTALIVPGHSSRTLQELGLRSSELPSLGMLNGAGNQDGCEGATVGLAYGGTAVWGDV